jgi:hypothetical protein
MLLVRLGFEGGIGIHWRLSGTGPASFALRGTDWELLNPLLYLQTSPGPAAPFTELDSGQFSGETNEIVFLHRSKTNDEFSKSDESLLMDLGPRMLTKLRHVSGQARAPQGKHLATIMRGEIQALPSFTPVPMPQYGPKSVSKYWFGVAVTDDHIETLAQQAEEYQPEVYDALLLDAIAAHMTSDFRSSVLYAAMAMEVACGAVMDLQYAKIIAGCHDHRYRTVRVPIAGGQVVVKDPIFERLREGTNFSIRLHELPLYTMGKSLLVEDQPLYMQARNLYTTRNKLVHSGVVEDSGSTDLCPLDQQGSFKALETVKKVLIWLNVDSGISLPVIEFVPIEKVRSGIKK